MMPAHEKRRTDLAMKEKVKEAKRINTEKAEKIDKAWDLVSDLNPY